MGRGCMALWMLTRAVWSYFRDVSRGVDALQFLAGVCIRKLKNLENQKPMFKDNSSKGPTTAGRLELLNMATFPSFPFVPSRPPSYWLMSPTTLVSLPPQSSLLCVYQSSPNKCRTVPH